MLAARVKRGISRLTVTAGAIVATMVIAAPLALASPRAGNPPSLSDTDWWGWTSITGITFDGDVANEVYFRPVVNDSSQDGWNVTVFVIAHDYDGTIRGQRKFSDTTHDNRAVDYGNQGFNAAHNSIFDISIQMCRTNSRGQTNSCHQRKYSYRP